MRSFAASMLANMKSLTNLCANILPGTGLMEGLSAAAASAAGAAGAEEITGEELSAPPTE